MATAALCLAFGFAQGQVVLEAFRTTARVLQDRGLIPRPIQPPPIQDVGHPAPPARVGTLPPPEEVGEGADELQILRGDIETEGNLVKMTGGVELVFRGYQIFANEITFDRSTQMADARGEVRVLGRDAAITGERVVVNFETRSFAAYDAWSELRPELLQGQLIAPLYVRGRVTEGTEREIRGIDTRSTTCIYEKPHFEILSKYLTVRPGRRAIF